MRRAFTMIELLVAVTLVGVLTTLSVMTFNAVSRGWQVSTDYIDKLQRTDYALNQVVSGLRSLYYPHDGQQNDNYKFVLNPDDDNLENSGKAGGEGKGPDDSDVIEWSKKGTAIVGNKNAVADTVHRVRLMILEEGNGDYKEPIKVTGLYARLCPDVTLRPKNNKEDVDFSYKNLEMYQPVLISDGIVGFNCRVLPDKDKVKKAQNDDKLFEDEWPYSNQYVPYKIELTFRMAGVDGKSYRSGAAPIVKIVRIPLYEQSKDGAAPPGSSSANKVRASGLGGRGMSGGAGGASSGGAK